MIFLVVVTVIVHGSFMPLFARCLLGSKEEIHHGRRKIMNQRTYGNNLENGEVKEKLINQNEAAKDQNLHGVHEVIEEDFESEELSDNSSKSGSGSGSEYEEFVHENAEESASEVYEQCECERCVPRVIYFGRLIAWIDHNWLKKLLVYNYSPENIKA